MEKFISKFFIVIVPCLCCPAVVIGQTTNAWTSPVSGNWEDASNWSLGIPPASNQAIMLTNGGFKAVAINQSTAQQFPQTLNVYSIMIASPANSFDELLLNFFGFQTPLTAYGFWVQSNSTVVALHSAVQVSHNNGPSGFSIGGTFIQSDSAQVNADSLTVGDLGPGVYYLTNGTLSVANTQFVGAAFVGNISQFGGSNSASNLRVQSGSEYDLYDGNFTGGITLSSGSFLQQGGSVNATGGVNLVRGTYTLNEGLLNTAFLGLPGIESSTNGPSSFLQAGGTNQSASLGIGIIVPPTGLAPGSYTLSNGVLVVPALTVGPFGRFELWGGSSSVSGDITFNGVQLFLNSWAWGSCGLGGGNLSAQDLSLGIGDFSQTGGTNVVAANLNIGPSPVHCIYNLSGGLLTTSNSVVMQGNLFGSSFNGGFLQGGGTHQVANLLRVSGTTKGFFGYILGGGQLTVQNLQVDSGATFQHTGGMLAAPGLVTLANGSWLCNTGQQQYGQLLLGVLQGANSTLSLPTGSCSLSFADSSAVVWSNSAILTIQNWAGSVIGGGNQQISFGTNQAGLTPQQVSQIQFRNPDGFRGTFPAVILPTGEIVPGEFLATARSGRQMAIEWAGPMFLQSATNLLGPYLDVTGASSPYMVDFSQPAQFFRLRQ